MFTTNAEFNELSSAIRDIPITTNDVTKTITYVLSFVLTRLIFTGLVINHCPWIRIFQLWYISVACMYHLHFDKLFTPILVMLQGRSISPVHRFLTKSGEWVWMQMCITLLYIPNTNKPYAATHLFRVIKYVSAWVATLYIASLCMCKLQYMGYRIAQNFGSIKVWQFMTNLPKFYPI